MPTTTAQDTGTYGKTLYSFVGQETMARAPERDFHLIA